MNVDGPEAEALRLIARQVADRLGEAGYAFVEDECLGALAETLHAFLTTAGIRILAVPEEPGNSQAARRGQPPKGWTDEWRLGDE
jgi:hypothetical protein